MHAHVSMRGKEGRMPAFFCWWWWEMEEGRGREGRRSMPVYYVWKWSECLPIYEVVKENSVKTNMKVLYMHVCIIPFPCVCILFSVPAVQCKPQTCMPNTHHAYLYPDWGGRRWKHLPATLCLLLGWEEEFSMSSSFNLFGDPFFLCVLTLEGEEGEPLLYFPLTWHLLWWFWEEEERKWCPPSFPRRRRNCVCFWEYATTFPLTPPYIVVISPSVFPRWVLHSPFFLYS